MHPFQPPVAEGKYLASAFIFCSFLKLWTPVEESFLKTTAFVFESSHRDSSTNCLYWCSPASGSYTDLCCHHISCSSVLLVVGSAVPGTSQGGREHPGSSPHHREQGVREVDVGPAHLSRQLKKNQHWALSAESALSFLGFLPQGVRTRATLLPTWRKRDLSFLHVDIFNQHTFSTSPAS